MGVAALVVVAATVHSMLRSSLRNGLSFTTALSANRKGRPFEPFPLQP